MKRQDMEPNSVWGENGKSIENEKRAKWPIALSTSSYDIYEVEGDRYMAFVYMNHHIIEITASTAEECLQKAIEMEGSFRRINR